MPELTFWQWVIGITAAFCVGVAKTGVPGLGIMVVPLMVLTVGDARKSAGWLLPILCMADLFALYYWRRHASAGRLFGLAPWVIAGCVAGAFALALPEPQIRPLVGCIVLLMLVAYLKRRFWTSASSEAENVPGAPYGVAAGFATTVANAAGPVMSLYLLSKRLPKEEFVATGAWFFFFVNLTKIPIYAYHGLFSTPSLAFDACMFPPVLAGAMTGRWIIHRIPARLFEASVVILTAASTVLLFR
ncbi:MAG: sulfite exporter TauE/SafE family protein [Bryobacteraceae bacterium]|nr:sulfite exporter TauE/SafE family protein [Bryobacteraceae bacterium]